MQKIAYDHSGKTLESRFTLIRLGQISLGLVTFIVSINCYADGSNVGRLHDPYVQQLEQELEYEFLFQSDDQAQFDNVQIHRIAYGQSLSDRWLVELGVSGSNAAGNDFDINEYELELKWQLTEQGEYSNDWAVLFELEHEQEDNIWEIGSSLVVLHQWKKWVGTTNLSLAYEMGDTIKSEMEFAIAAQLKYRYKATVEPSIEFFKNEDTNALGPGLSGQFRLGGRKKLYWSTGLAFSLNSTKADETFRANIEYEF